MEMDTDSLNLALPENQLYNCIRSEKGRKKDFLRSKDYNGSFSADTCNNFLPHTCCE